MSVFTNHPKSVNETYLQHQRFAFGIAWKMFKGSFFCLIHGLFPFLFEKTGSEVIRELNQTLDNNGREEKSQK